MAHFAIHDAGAAGVTILFLERQKVLADHLADLGRAAQQILQILDLPKFFLVLVSDLAPLQAGQAPERHVQNGLGLDFGQAETIHQVGARRIGCARATDGIDHLVDKVHGSEKPFQDVRPQLGLFQQVAAAPGDDLLAVLQIVDQHPLEGKKARLPIDQSEHGQAERGLHRRQLEQLPHDLPWLNGPCQLDADAHPLPIRFVPEVGDALDLAISHQFGDTLDEAGFVDLIGQFADDDAAAVTAHLLDVDVGLHGESSPAQGVGIAHQVEPIAIVILTSIAVNNATGGKIGPLDEAGQVLHRHVVHLFIVVDQKDQGIDDLAQVVGRDVGGHADGDA